jgi:ADP-ribosylglycohydrolase
VALTSIIALILQGHEFLKAYEFSVILTKNFIFEYTQEVEKKIIANQEKGQIFQAVKENFSADVLEFYLKAEIDQVGRIDLETMGFTYFCLACGFWGSRQQDWVTAMRKIVLKGGDADTNGAVAGAVLGCKLGFDALPQHLVTGMRHYSWLKEKADLLIEKIRPSIDELYSD